MAEAEQPRRPPIELEVEVEGTAEEVWTAIATGPGISSWYVPHIVEEREGGAATASFGEGTEMQVSERVAVWDPPRRVVFDGGDADEGLAFEWLIESKSGGTCIVRLVNSGFIAGDEWDDYYEGMTEGWKIFLTNLELHCRHFRGQTATASLPLATWLGPSDTAWHRLTSDLGIASAVNVGDRINIDVADAPELGGTVVAHTPHRINLLVDTPAVGTAFIAVEGRSGDAEVSVWTYLYGGDGAAASKRDGPRWRKWLTQRSET
ncbi:MAG: SRPBCC domain-containing protein [Acidimicrobiia bacterium]|nr:SRPBCC domain-containing protein [Acidimicrobiia bacterium]